MWEMGAIYPFKPDFAEWYGETHLGLHSPAGIYRGSNNFSVLYLSWRHIGINKI